MTPLRSIFVMDKCNKKSIKEMGKAEGPTEIWTRIAGFKVQSANHYTMGPRTHTRFSQRLCLRITFELTERKILTDEDEIRTHAGRAHWISSPTP